MIRLFHPNTQKMDLIQYNGDYILDKICYSALITEELNGEFSLNLKVVITDKMDKGCYDLIVEGALLVVNDEYGDEYFRIASVDKDLDEIEIYARQITIADTLTMWLEDVRPKEQNGNGAINWIFDHAVGGNKWFRVASNIQTVKSANYVNKTLYEAISSADNSFLKRWGGEISRRGFELRIDEKVGENRGVVIRSRKNLIGFESSTNINELTTRIYPKGYNGITIKEKYVDSDNISKYPKIYSREYKFDDIRVNDENYTEGFSNLEEAQKEMTRRCKNLYEFEKIDKINAKYNINFVDLSKTEQYKNYSILEMTKIGDTVTVVEEKLGVNIEVRVLKRQYDVLEKRRVSTTLSDKDIRDKKKIPDFIQSELDKRPTNGQVKDEVNAGVADRPTNSEVNDKVNNAKDELEQAFEEEKNRLEGQIEKLPTFEDVKQEAIDTATGLLNAGIKDSNVVLKQNELLIMDTKDVDTAKKVWRYNVNGLGYSKNGYHGRYETAMTMDGAIVADFITVGTINADLIKSGTINANLIKTGIIDASLIKSGVMLADRIRGGMLTSIDENLKIDLSGKEGLIINNGNVSITNNRNTVFKADINGNLNIQGTIITNKNQGQLKLEGNKLEGYKNDYSQTPIYACGVWHPDQSASGTQAGFVSVSTSNALVGDSNGTLYMTGTNQGDIGGKIRYSVNEASTSGEFNFYKDGGVSLSCRQSGNDTAWGWRMNNEGYLLPLNNIQFNESIGSSDVPWHAIYTRKTLSERNLIKLNNDDSLKYILNDNIGEKEETETKQSICEYIKALDFGLYEQETDTKDFRLSKTKTIKPIQKTKNHEEYIDLMSYSSSLTIALQEAFKQIEELKKEIQELKK